MSDLNTGKQGGAPAMPNNFTGQKPKDAKAPNGIASINSKDRGKDGTQK